jgi:hypothetical protein
MGAVGHDKFEDTGAAATTGVTSSTNMGTGTYRVSDRFVPREML